MMSVSSATETVAIDPTLLALIPVLTVVLTIIAGLTGAWIQGRRERARWLRERRLQVYEEFLATTDEFFLEGSDAEPGDQPSEELLGRIRRASASIHLLGPDRVYVYAQSFQEAMLESLRSGSEGTAEDARLATRRAFIVKARAALR